jgi:hypothetical protein
MADKYCSMKEGDSQRPGNVAESFDFDLGGQGRWDRCHPD